MQRGSVEQWLHYWSGNEEFSLSHRNSFGDFGPLILSQWIVVGEKRVLCKLPGASEQKAG